MAKDNRRIITWSLNAGKKEYEDDLENYSHKIYSIGLHEFNVTKEGKIRDERSKQYYFDASENHTGVRFPIVNENHMIKYPSIKWFFQIIIFGWSTVKPVLDNNVVNSEGRLPQDQFVYELNKLLDLYEGSRNSGTPLNVAGVEMDVESTMTDDYVSSGNDVNYIRFLEKIKNEVIIPRQLKMRVNAHAMWGEQTPFYYRFHNYKLFAESTDKNGNATIDEIQLMTYDFAWNGSAAGASTPIWWLRNVGDWCRQNFDPKVNPNAKLTIDNLFFGAAGYGHRWGMHTQDEVKSGSTITFRNLLGWANGLYKHYHTEFNELGWTNPETGGKYYSGGELDTYRFVYENQEYLYQAAFQDDKSKNEIMYPHVYDMFKPKYVEVKTQDGGKKSATVGTYNGNDYAASNFKQQMPIWTGVHAIATKPSSFSGKSYPVVLSPEYQGMRKQDLTEAQRQTWDKNLNPDSVDFKHLVKSVDGVDKVFVGWYTEDLIYVEKYNYDDMGNVLSAVCVPEDNSEGRINYTVNVPSAGNYHLVAITSFSWYTQMKLGGYANGQQFNIGGDAVPEWYPFILKGSHFYDCGTFSFNSGSNTISVHGELSEPNTPIYGFIVCDNFDQNFSGGELTVNANIQPMTKKDGTKANIPSKLALAAKMLRHDARPAILWDDEFRTYNEGTEISRVSYYQRAVQDYDYEGGGTVVKQVDTVDGQPVFKCFSAPIDIGYTGGTWIQKDYALYFNSTSSGQLILSKQWTVNLSIEVTIDVERGDKAGIRFYVQKQGTVADGYLFILDFKKGVQQLVLEENDTWTVVASQALGNVSYGRNVRLKVLLHNGVGYFYVGGVQAFVQGDGNPVTTNGDANVATGEVTMQRRSGACGLYANNAELYCSHLGISTTDRWETLEKFEVTVDGTTKELGRINRTGYEYDEFGYLIYSGLNETETRDSTQFFDEDVSAVSLDYEVTVFDWDSWEGGKDITIKLRDAGVWFSELLVGDKNGMSVIWAGDAWSFQDAMNIAVNDYGAKGIGLWTMGQEDPTLFELVPDVVPKK